MDNPTRLEDIYTDVQVLDTRESRRFESPETLKELYLEIGRGFAFERTTRQNGIAVANLNPRLMVLGSPGIGKSTFLRKVGLEALKWETSGYRHEVIPVFVELKRFDSSQTSIEKFIAQEFEICGFSKAEVFTQRLLKAGKLLILLDGLDEVPIEHVDRAIEQIGNLVDRYDQNRFIASCRIAAYKGGFPRFKDVTMASFDDSQMETFVRRWFRREPKIAGQCWELLKSSAYRAAKELGQTPLLLTLLCAVYNESQNLPKQRAALYGEALEVWLRKWASEKRIAHDPIYRELSLELEQLLLSEIAYKSFAEDQLFFSKRELTEQIREFLVSNLNAPKHLDAEAVLNAIQVQQGILVERARDTYSFSHLTFQEYLNAQYIVDEGQVRTLVAQHLIDKNWREVFLLVAGLVRSANDLLESMANKAQTFLNTEKLSALIAWAEQNTKKSQGVYRPLARRALAIYTVISFAFDSIPYSIEFYLDPSLEDGDYAIELVYWGYRLSLVFEKNRLLNPALAEIFDSVDFTTLSAQLKVLAVAARHNEPDELGEASVNCLLQTWYDALHFDREWLDLSEEEVRSLENYLYVNELMIRCKEAALRVSPQVWEGIESRMLTVGD